MAHMKKWNFRNVRIKSVSIDDIDDRMLLINLYLTQAITLVIGLLITTFQKNYVWRLFPAEGFTTSLLWGAGLAAAVMAADFLVSLFVPEEVTNDGGINERMFGGRALWHIAVLSLIVALCEEILFRGAIQHALGPYWTSILFAAIHVRYLRHWLMTGLTFSISYALGWIYLQTGSLWAPVAAHFLIDFISGCIIKYGKKTAS